MKIGDRCFVHGYIDEIRKDTVIIRNNGGYFGTIPSEVITGELQSARPENQVHLCDSCRYVYPDCPSKKDDVIYGNGKGNDNICACNKYEPSKQPEQRRGEESLIIDGFQRECIEQAQLNRIDIVKDTVTGTATAKSYNVPAMRGWVCPVCGRGLSPYTSVCPCNNGKGWEITC